MTASENILWFLKNVQLHLKDIKKKCTTASERCAAAS